MIESRRNGKQIPRLNPVKILSDPMVCFAAVNENKLAEFMLMRIRIPVMSVFLDTEFQVVP